jgi:glycosyltransferase involved in cell wall biosynthesis
MMQAGRRVLHVISNMGTFGRIHVLFLIDELCRKGGAEVALLNAVRWLPANRFRCSVITFRMDPSLPMLAEYPCPVQLLPLTCVYDWNAVKRGAELAGFIRREGVDIVHTFFPSADLWGGMVAKLARCPILISSRRDMGFMRRAKHRVGYRALAPMFDKVLAVSEEVRHFSIAHDRLAPSKVSTLYNAVDLTRVPGTVDKGEILERLGVRGATQLIASVGNLRRVKGFDVLVRAAAVVCRKFPKAVFVVAGGQDPAEPQCLRDLEKLCAELGMANNVKFLGPLENPLLLVKASDAFCLLSRSEGFSNALLEAMACGTPCVATRAGGNPEALDDGHSGFLVDSGDHESAAVQICRLLRDKELAQRIGDRGRDAIGERFTHEVVIAQLIGIYDELLAVRKRPVGEA